MRKQISFICPDCEQKLVEYLHETDKLYGKDVSYQQKVLKRKHDLVCTCSKVIGYVNLKVNYHQLNQIKYYVNRLDKDGSADEIITLVEEVLTDNKAVI